MKSIWEAHAQREIHDRLETVTADRRGRWGKMTSQQMVCHLTESLRMALGDLKVAPKRLPIRYPPLKQLIIYAAPFPKNAPTAPELIIGVTPNEMSRDIEALQQQLDRFVARGPGARFEDHPAFGRLSPRAWGVLVYRHMDHHLKQFGA
jgi:uncharacterized protein DUF1569